MFTLVTNIYEALKQLNLKGQKTHDKFFHLYM